MAKGQQVNIPVLNYIVICILCFEISKSAKVDWIEKLLEYNAMIIENLFGESLLILGVSEKNMHRYSLAVPRSNTGALAEKAKT